MKDRDTKSDSNAGYIWLGLLVVFFTIYQKENSKRRDPAPKPRPAAEVPVMAHARLGEDGITTFEASLDGSDPVVIARESKPGQHIVNTKTSREIVVDDNGDVVTETIRGGAAARSRIADSKPRGHESHVVVVRENKAKEIAERVEARVAGENDERLRQLEAKLSAAGEKLREAAERAGSKISEKSSNVIISRILGEGPPPVPPVPPVPGVPPVPPMPSFPKFRAGGEKEGVEDAPKESRFQVRSAPCATRGKAIGEAEAEIAKIVEKRLARHGLDHPDYVRNAVESLHPKYVVEESYREVAGERYPLYVASAEIQLGVNFERQALRLVNQRVAHRRFAGLMGLSFGLVALLVGLDQLGLGRPRSPVPAGKGLV